MFRALKGGCNTKQFSSFKMSRPQGLQNYVLLIVKSQGDFVIDGQPYALTPGQAIIFSPYTPYFYQNPQGDYIDDWIHFDLDNPMLLKEKNLKTNIPFSVKQTDLFTILIKQILWENSYSSPPFQTENIDALFTLLINHLAASQCNSSDKKYLNYYYEQLQLIRLELQSSPSDNPSIEECADKLGISPSYFQHLYTSYFGNSYKKDLIDSRLSQAKYLMKTTDFTLEQIAEICGYHNEVHFYRQFKKNIGITPAKYRKEDSQSF